MRALGIIPARGASKRVPRKNARLLGGKPLICYTIQAALQSTSIERLIVSTDDIEIARIAQECGAEVPFLRPAYLAKDTIPDQSVFLHTLVWLQERETYEPEIVLNLRPTTPFKSSRTIERVIHTMMKTNADIVRTMTLVEGVNHPYWMYKLSDTGQASPFLGDVNISEYYQRQLLPPVYRINGVVDAIKPHIIYGGNMLINENMMGVVISELESIDIDTEFDFLFCEFIVASGKLDEEESVNIKR